MKLKPSASSTSDRQNMLTRSVYNPTAHTSATQADHHWRRLLCGACVVTLCLVAATHAQAQVQSQAQAQAATESDAARVAAIQIEPAKTESTKPKVLASADVAMPVPQPEAATEFLRMTLAGEEPRSLDTAVVTYRSTQAGGVSVDLIGAVHIGESSYYAELNKLFDQYDVLLYELVAPEGAVIPKGGVERRGFNPVAMLQDGAKNMLGLESQLELVDYTKAHFVRADMTPTQIAAKMEERGDTALTLALDTISEALRQQQKATKNPASSPLYSMQQDINLSDMFSNPLKMKRLLALQFADSGSLDQAMGGALNELLIVDRNAEALKGLQKQIAAGKNRIGIFYGAAHLADFEKHLVEDFGLRKTHQSWLKAWDLTQAKEPQLSQPASLMLNLLKAIE